MPLETRKEEETKSEIKRLKNNIQIIKIIEKISKTKG